MQFEKENCSLAQQDQIAEELNKIENGKDIDNAEESNYSFSASGSQFK